MIVLYTLLIVTLVTARFLVGRRVARLEKKYLQTVNEADSLVAETLLKESSKPEALTIAGVPVQRKTLVKDGKIDPAQTAKRQYLLGVLVEKKDRLEEKHHRWALRVERVSQWVRNLRNWKGRLVPYALGAVDILTTMCTLDYVSHGDFVVLRHLVDLVTAKFSA